jgi:hypothetical protein
MDAKLIKAANGITKELDRMRKVDFVGRDDFSALLTNADALSTHSKYGKFIKVDLDYLWKTFEHEVDTYIRKGGDVSGFNAEFLVNKLREYWINFTRRISEEEDNNKEGEQNMDKKETLMKAKESRMASLIGIKNLKEEKRYEPRAALDHLRAVNTNLKGIAGDISRAKVIAIDYDTASKAATIERLYKQLTEEMYSVEEVLTLEVEKEDKKVLKAEEELAQAEEPEVPEAEEVEEPEEEEEELGGEEEEEL